MANLKDEILAGMAGGLAGAAAMSMAMMIGEKTGMVTTPVPLKIERRIEKRLHAAEKTSPAQERALAQLGHFMIGGLMGAGYGAIHAATDGAAIPSGPLYGLGVYALNFMGIGPATSLLRGPWQQEPASVGREIMMHAVYGTVTALVAERLLQEMDERQFRPPAVRPAERRQEETFAAEEYDEMEMPEPMRS